MLYVSQIYCLKIILTLHFLRIPRGQVNYIYPKIICIYHAKLRNLYAGQEATVRTGHWTTDWFQIGKEYIKAVYCHPAYLTYMQNTSWEMLGWVMHKLESRLPGEISITSDMQITPLLWQKVKKNSRASWRKWKGWLKAQHSENEDHGVWSHHFMANRLGNSGNSGWLYFGGAPKSLQIVIAAMKLKDTYSLEGKLWPTSIAY